MINLTIIAYGSADEEVFQRYIKAAFHEKYILSDPRYLEWQYGKSLFLIKNGNEVIGHFGFRDIVYKIYDTSMPVRVLMNLFVNEPYRLTGVAALLATHVFDTNNPVLVSGYTALAQNLFSHLRKNWKNAGVLRRAVAVLNANVSLLEGYAIPQMAVLGTVPQEIRITREVPSESFIDQSWERAKDRYPITIERNFAYINWRFITHPFFSYIFLIAQQNGLPCGYLIGRIEEDQGFRIARIIDCIATQEIELPLLQEFLTVAKQESASVVDFLLSGTLYDGALTGAGFFEAAGTDFERFPILFSPLSFKKVSVNIGYDIDAPFEDCFFTKADGDQDRPNPH